VCSAVNGVLLLTDLPKSNSDSRKCSIYKVSMPGCGTVLLGAGGGGRSGDTALSSRSAAVQ
jgi:hypothetical protein